MAKDKLTDYDSTASGNLDVGGISVAEGMLPSGVNNAIREQMSHLADFAAGTQPITKLATASIDANSGTIKLDGNYPVGTGNVALGDGAGSSITSGGYSTFIGTSAGAANTEGQNTFVGGQAGQNNTTGTNNIGLGVNALQQNTTGNLSSAVGHFALQNNTSGANNTSLGYQSLNQNTTASDNTAVGYRAMYDNTTGARNSAFGLQALYNNTTAGNNNAFGYLSLYTNTTGAQNVAMGTEALFSNTTASNNTAVGYQAGLTNTTGAQNTMLGERAGQNTTTGNYNCYVGGQSGQNATTGSQNNFLGWASGYNMTTGSKNTIIGGFQGNQGGLDIRTSDNNIVLSDGDGNPRAIYKYYSGAGLRFWGFNLSDADQPAVYGYTSGGGVSAREDGLFSAARSGGNCANFNRTSDDGAVVSITQNGSTEGTISVSGTVVTYNGGHLGRWSRLLDNSKDASIVKGTVMTNLDEMVEWGDEDNEQLNKMAVSSVEGDANVAGVFVNWDNDDDWNDMNVAMTGDMVIRIAQGTTVARGDLLMSAGDGTAKPQGDDIVRSKTIAKVTSTNVSHTHDDGSYLVPCVLMAC